ncbi:hypothetical protein Bca101_020796 [Brassica carinata]
MACHIKAPIISIHCTFGRMCISLKKYLRKIFPGPRTHTFSIAIPRSEYSGHWDRNRSKASRRKRLVSSLRLHQRKHQEKTLVRSQWIYTDEILSRLPAKSIARCRVVSKEWGFILSSQYFTDLFLKMSSLSPCILFTFQAEGKWSFFSSPESMLISDQKSSSVAVDSLSHVPIDYPISVCVPVCGLLCTKDEWVLSGKKDAMMMICNPSTGGFKLLPKVKTRRRRVLTYLGYDPVEKVHKVLCMTSREKPVSLQAEQHQVLTLGTGKINWRMIESEKFKFIVDEAFKDIKYPSTLINYKGKLGILHPNASGFMEGRATGFVLWVIDDIENHKWCKKTIISPSPWWSLVAGTRSTKKNKSSRMLCHGLKLLTMKKIKERRAKRSGRNSNPDDGTHSCESFATRARSSGLQEEAAETEKMKWLLLLLLLCRIVPLQGQTTFKSLIGKVIKVAMQAAVDDVNANPTVLNNTHLNIIMHDTKFNGFMSIMERTDLGVESSGVNHNRSSDNVIRKHIEMVKTVIDELRSHSIASLLELPCNSKF